LHVSNYASAGRANLVSDLEHFLTGLAHNEISVGNTAFCRQNYAVFADDAHGRCTGQIVFAQRETPIRETPRGRINKGYLQ